MKKLALLLALLPTAALAQATYPGGNPPPPPDAVAGPRDARNPGCETRSVTRTDSAGNSETKSKTDC